MGEFFLVRTKKKTSVINIYDIDEIIIVDSAGTGPQYEICFNGKKEVMGGGQKDSNIGELIEFLCDYKK